MDDEKITIEWNPFGSVEDKKTTKEEDVRSFITAIIDTYENMCKLLPNRGYAKGVTIKLVTDLCVSTLNTDAESEN